MSVLGRNHAARNAQLAAVAIALLTLTAVGCGSASDPTQPVAPDTTSTTNPERDRTTTRNEGGGVDAGPSPEHEVRAAVRQYVTALDDRDGGAICSLFAAGALDQLDLPEERGSCAASVAASLGHRDPRGYPVWQSSEIVEFGSTKVGAGDARATVTVRTLYAGDREPSIEDDVIYLKAGGGEWMLAKPSVTLYRAIGVPDAPPSVLAPP